MALSATARLALSYYADSTSYSPLEYNEDIYNNVWGKTMTGNESLDDDDLAMQRIYVDRLSTNVNEIKQIGKVRIYVTTKRCGFPRFRNRLRRA